MEEIRGKKKCGKMNKRKRRAERKKCAKEIEEKNKLEKCKYM